MASPQGRVTGLLLQFAGEQSLADRVRAEGLNAPTAGGPESIRDVITTSD